MRINLFVFRAALCAAVLFLALFAFFTFHTDIYFMPQTCASIFTGALITAVFSYLAYRKEKEFFVRRLAMDLRNTFEYIDQYDEDRDYSYRYFEAYYHLYYFILNRNFVLDDYEFKGNPETEALVKECENVIYHLKKLLKEVYVNVRMLDEAFKKNNTYMQSKSNGFTNEEVKSILDGILKNLNDYVIRLKKEDKLNLLANELYKPNPDEIMVNRVGEEKNSENKQ